MKDNDTNEQRKLGWAWLNDQAHARARRMVPSVSVTWRERDADKDNKALLLTAGNKVLEVVVPAAAFEDLANRQGGRDAEWHTKLDDAFRELRSSQP